MTLQSKNKANWKSFKGRGKKVAEWDKVRAQLKTDFESRGITSCEICGRTSYLSFAHRLKRRKITDSTELRVVALLCMDSPDGTGCHNRLEFGPPDVMYEVITSIWLNRLTRP